MSNWSSSISSTVEKNGSSENSAGSMKDTCVSCGQRFDQVGKRNSKTRELVMGHKKLHLVLDLDHTLLHTTSIGSTEWKRYLLEGDYHSLEEIFLRRKIWTVTKLRPFVRTFLKEASKMFELSVYTMGDRLYAQDMVELLDPKNEYFGDRVVSRDDSTKESEKNLDVVCAKESAVLVLDDTQRVWAERNQDNVIPMKKYIFFRNRCYDSSMSHSELRTYERDEQTQGTYLAAILQLLKQIHGMFFDDRVAAGENLVDRDVRQVLYRFRGDFKKLQEYWKDKNS